MRTRDATRLKYEYAPHVDETRAYSGIFDRDPQPQKVVAVLLGLVLPPAHELTHILSVL